MKKSVVGILAHVDAGKTTLTEALLYKSGMLSKLGRVDKRDAYLDTHSLERERGITIFSKQAQLETEGLSMTLIDTPGHIDFSCEAERALSIQDYAILIISAQDGVTAHTKTLWHLLASRRIPTFIFVNKTDIAERRRDDLVGELKNILSPACVDFSNDTSSEFYEEAAGCDERLIEEFFETEALSRESLAHAVAKRRIFPCLFGSALKLKGIDELLLVLEKYIIEKKYSDTIFGARVYKIGRDAQGKRITYLKVTGGSIKPKDTVTVKTAEGEEIAEKIEEIRIYSGDKFKSVYSAGSSSVVAVLGLAETKAGMGLGAESDDRVTLTPVLDYRMILPRESSPYETYMRLMVLTEEDPSLALSYNSSTHEIRVRLMGEIQLEVLSRVILDRFGIAVTFDEGSILYKETISDEVYGRGHFEPLRHYAEVHLRIEPMPEGTGVITATECPTDTLALNWQRLIITHIEERMHRGVLTGSPLTDVKITVVAGRAHVKHTEGGDFRQATYRAVRQGLMKARSVLLEPTFDFRIELPAELLGRAMNDITNMYGVSEAPEFVGDMAILEGNCPVATMRSYASELRAYTRGEGRIVMTVGPYKPCHNTEEIIADKGYDPLLDERNPTGSVFCKAGAGYAVPWNEADSLMHVEVPGIKAAEDDIVVQTPKIAKSLDYRGTVEEDKELMRIFESTYGKIKPRRAPEKVENSAPTEKKSERPRKLKPKGENYLIIDGYNFIFATDELRKIAEADFARGRDVLVRMMCDYSSFHKIKTIIVFDAYKRAGGEGSEEIIGDVTVVYTKESQTADAFIERTTYEIAGEHTVRVVTGDLQEQLVILGSGGLRVSTSEFWDELRETALLIKEKIEEYMK